MTRSTGSETDPASLGYASGTSAAFLRTVLLLIASNVFMTFAWFAHLGKLQDRRWYVAAIVSWGVALFESLRQVPSNRIGYREAGLSLPQLKVLQEVITLSVFVPFAMLYMKQPVKLDFLWAGLCMVGAVYFMFRGYGAIASPPARSSPAPAPDPRAA